MSKWVKVDCLRLAKPFPKLKVFNVHLSWQSWKKYGGNWQKRYTRSLTDLIFPPSCLLCGRFINQRALDSNTLLCHECVDDFSYAGATPCEKCASPLPKIGEGTGNCLYCRERRYRFHATLALGVYRGGLREAVLRMKMSYYESLMLAVGRLLAERVRATFANPSPQLIVPVPMHWMKRLWRGANSPDLLAESMARELKIATLPGLLRLRRRAGKQGTLLPGERMKNVRGVFRVSRRYDIAGKHVLLVDDVMTTGATASEAAKMLRRAGASRVSVAVAARGVGIDEP